nr:MAG TPA: hypothetical protein [Caudoviricetes sp.]
MLSKNLIIDISLSPFNFTFITPILYRQNCHGTAVL